MARALLVLACAACAAAARYGDYAGARMPQYGGDYDAQPHTHAREPDDYRGHSPDAPAALDYKYEEDLSNSQIGKTEPPPGNEVEESESWQQRPARKHKKSRVVDVVDTDHVDRFDPDDDFPKPRGNRFTKHQTRHKSRKFERNDDDSPRYPVNHRGRSDDGDIEEESQLDKDFRNDKSKSFDDDRYAHRVGSERVVRRKPRDRQMKKKMELDSEELDKAIADPDQWIQEGLGRAPPPGPLEAPLEAPLPSEAPAPGRAAKRRRPDDDPVRFFREEDDEDEPSPQGEKSRKKIKNYGDYASDYYDMKRVMNIKKKLPSLMRRPTTPDVMPIRKGSTRSFEDFMANRRVFIPPLPATRTSIEPQSPEPRTRPPFTTTTTTEAATTKSTTPNITNELSLAEKSRLSILKKAQRKESLHLDSPTKKPPVLLQVTKKLPTVVMVEPPSSQQPWMRAREVFNDSPERLEKVKQLMRHKLVANAKNIHELTDNWDDLVCDYIDMSLLDSVSSSNVPRGKVFLMTSLVQMIIMIR
ncbi:hypothetical protein ABMA27_000609 [Loxostege sticticalis]|uniref:Uncharacterized protein n=1 Tax=Loxostege sticticalis TaxID=481309 RepID=A0ABR3IP08_LOXSC